MSAILEAQGLRKVYRGGDGTPIEVLPGVDLAVAPRASSWPSWARAARGRARCSTCWARSTRPTAGQVRLDGLVYGEQTADALAAVRNRKIGFVFQFHHLLREFTRAGERDDAAADRRGSREPGPLARGGAAGRGRAGRADDATARRSSRAASSSARRWPGRWPPIRVVVLADEPSGNLDHGNSERLHELFARLAREFETALVVVTHNRLLAGRADRVLSLEGGRLVPLSGVESMP